MKLSDIIIDLCNRGDLPVDDEAVRALDNCQHPSAYVCGECDVTDPASDRYWWECPSCGDRCEDTNDMDLAVASLQAARTIKH